MNDNFFHTPDEIELSKKVQPSVEPNNDTVTESTLSHVTDDTGPTTFVGPMPAEQIIAEVDHTLDEPVPIEIETASQTPVRPTNNSVDYYTFVPEDKRQLNKTVKQKKRPFRKFVAGLLVFALVGGTFFGAGFATNALIQGNQPTSSASTPVTIQQVENVIHNETETVSIPELVAKSLSPSVVTVNVTYESASNNFFYDLDQEGSGSGVIFDITDTELQLVTNYHVISGADLVEIKTYMGDLLTAKVLGYDSKQDLAVLAVPLSDIPAEVLNQLTIASFADSSTINQGELAIAIGSPLGETFSNSVTVGVVSSVERSLTIDGFEHTLIQTDAAINPGNSGGALFNSEGLLIGINTAKWQEVSVEGLGFAIPMNIAKPIIEDIVSNPTGSDFAQTIPIDRPFLGVRISEVTSEIAQATGVPFGVYVDGTFEGSGAYEAGLKSGDVIVAIDGEKVLNATDLTSAILNKKIGDFIDITIIRNGEVIEKSAELYNYADFSQ